MKMFLLVKMIQLETRSEYYDQTDQDPLPPSCCVIRQVARLGVSSI